MSDKPHTPRIDINAFKSACRLLITVPLKVADGTNGRFQPTGFPDLGPALYKGVREFEEKDGTDGTKKVQRAVNMLFSDTAAALGNWLEEACLSGDDYNPDCQGIPYVRVLDGDGSGEQKPFLTSSVREPHRLASPYVLSAKRDGGQETMKDWLRKPEQFSVNKQRPVRPWVLAQKLFSIDPGCILHGVFLEELDGRLRLPRLLSGFIEAANPNQVNYGGVYRGEVSAKDNIPFSKQEFTSDDIHASFILHLSTLSGHNLTADQTHFLILWSLYKIDTLLRRCLRLRSGCEFQAISILPTVDGKSWNWVPSNAGTEAAKSSTENEKQTASAWPTSADILADFTAAKEKCFPVGKKPENETEADKWKRQQVTVVTWQDDIKPTPTALENELVFEATEFGDFAERISLKEHDFATKRGGKKAAPDKKQALFIKGNWDREDFDELNDLVAQFPEQIESEGGAMTPNPKRAFVQKAAEAHRKVLRAIKKKKEGKKEDSEES
jgi:CRISPR-associated protein Csb1